ncbi:MAG: hypothetical protein HRU46_16740 [Verrucomicrobiales bacterium]|nr:hypothetical protein [Verrucomicrobiales bacterium]
MPDYLKKRTFSLLWAIVGCTTIAAIFLFSQLVLAQIDTDGDDIYDEDEIALGTNPELANPHFVGEVGTLKLSQVDRNGWTPVTLQGVYSDPVIVAGAVSNSGDAATARIRNISAVGFEIQIAEFEYLDGVLNGLTVHYCVMEKGAHVLGDGTRVEAGRSPVDGTVVETITYVSPFAEAPVLLPQITTQNDSRVAVVRQSNTTMVGADLIIQNSELEDETVGLHAEESVDWIAWEPGTGVTLSGAYLAGQSDQPTNWNWISVNIADGFFQASDSVALITSLASSNNEDPGVVRYRNFSQTGVELKIQDEQSYSDGDGGGNDYIDYLILPTGYLGYLATTADADADGLPDAWQLEVGLVVGGSLDAYDVSYFGDPDADGFANGEEYLYYGGRPFIAYGFDGLVDWEVWTGLSGATVADLTSDPRFLGAPDDQAYLTRLDGPVAYDDYFGSRIRGRIIPQETGLYRFWISGNFAGELWLSSDETSFPKRKIASHRKTDPQQWDKFAEQKSGWFTLTEGAEYYFEVLHVEDQWTDHVTVGWQRPGGEIEIIEGQFLRSWRENSDDLDDDSLPDAWESLYGLDSNDNGSVSTLEGQRGNFDGDDWNNLEEFQLGLNPTVAEADTDGDSLPDAWEQVIVDAFAVVNSVADVSATGDDDGDGLNNADELAQGTSPISADSDGDSLRDGWEIEVGFDPRVPICCD